MIKVRSYYDEAQKEESDKAALSFPQDEGRVKSEFKKSVDVNHIVKKYQEKGVLTHVNKALPKWAVEASSLTYHEAMLRIQEAHEEFDRLPAVIRKKFDNNAENMLKFIADDKNRDKAIEYGLIEKPVVAKVEPPLASDSLPKAAPAPVVK